MNAYAVFITLCLTKMRRIGFILEIDSSKTEKHIVNI